MRIISDKHDYYDCIQATGQDLDMVYLRKEEEVEIGSEYPFPKLRFGHTRVAETSISQYVIGFCGKIHPVLKIEVGYFESGIIFCYDIDSVDAVFERLSKKKQLKYYHGTEKHRYKSWEARPFFRRKTLKEFFDKYETIRENFEDLFRLRKSPIFIAPYCERAYNKPITMTINPILKDYEFFKVVDTYTAYQEISMYLGGVLGSNNKPIPEVSDKDLASAKGFTKWSFRTPPKGK